MSRAKGPISMESWMILNGKPGEVFYTEKSDRYLTAVSRYYNKKINTERVVMVTRSKLNPEATSVTKVTILK